MTRTVREESVPRPIVVTGLLAAELARQLAADGDTSLVRVDATPEHAAVFVVVLASTTTADTVTQLRRATRASIPVIAVRTGPDEGRIPYVGASETVDVPPGSGFPVDEIAELVAVLAGSRAVGLAASLPRLRPFVTRSLLHRASATTAAIGSLPLMPSIHFPAMLHVQQRLVLDLAVVEGQKLDATERAPELAGTFVAGLAARTVARRLPLPRRVTGALTGFAVTRAVGEAARLRFASTQPSP